MVAAVRVYVEGGGDDKDTRGLVRKGLSQFLKHVVAIARERRIKWHVVACGSRNSTVDDFRTALRKHPHAFNVLLVDSEDRVALSVRQHLRNRDGWDLNDVDDEHCHVMAQVMEAWLVADIQALKEYYGQKFLSNSIPKTTNVELIDKSTLYSALVAATRHTTKGQYHKVKHGPEILGRLHVAKVRSRAEHCDRLLAVLEEKVSS